MSKVIVQKDFLVGVTDVPVGEKTEAKDQLDVGKYVSGLVDFITHCRTPMTVAMQGDWGTGKTSFINLIEKKLVENTKKMKQKEQVPNIHQAVKTIKFNTWKYAQFNQEQNLHISFLGFLISELVKTNIYEVMNKSVDEHVYGFQNDSTVPTEQSVGKKLLSNLMRLTVPTILSTIEPSLSEGMLSLNLSNIVPLKANQDDADSKLKTQMPFNMQLLSQLDSAQVIESLRKDFQDAVDACIEEEEVDRIVIFIDDLDRLEPKLAVRLLEVIKLFLDVDNCVFVLAIDYEVVVQGLLSRFEGDTIEVKRAKAQNFFDKIIQVPFHIPTHFYQFNNFIFENLKTHINDIQYVETLSEIFHLSVNDNPRAVKRLLNSFYLISSISGIKENGKESAYLLATLCMQLSYGPAYRYFVNKLPENMVSEDVTFTIDDFYQFNEDNIKELHNVRMGQLHEVEIERNIQFVGALADVIMKFALINPQQISNLDELSENQLAQLQSELSIFIKVLNQSKITDEKTTKENDAHSKFEETTLEKFMNKPNRKNFKIQAVGYKDMGFSESATFVGKLERVLHEIANDPQFEHVKHKWSDTIGLLQAGVRQRFIDEMVKVEYEKNPEYINSIIKEVGLNGTNNGFKNFPAKKYFELDNTEFKMNKNYHPEGFIENLYPVLKYIHEDISSSVTITYADKVSVENK